MGRRINDYSELQQVSVPTSEFMGLVYHDLFKYPLNEEELKYWQIGEQKEPFYQVEKFGGFYFLSGRVQTIIHRITTRQENEKKYKIAFKTARILGLLPSIVFVGISGSLAMGSADKNDDIDLFIITSKGSLWITRFFSWLIIKLAGRGIKIRKYKEKQVKNKICLNMWLSADNLDFSDRMEVYTAHEVVQVKPLVDKGVYRNLLLQNKWIEEFFPHAYKTCLCKSKSPVLQKHLWQGLILSAFIFLEPLFHFLQYQRLRKKKTTEKVTKTHAFFHPVSWRKAVPQIFLSRLERFSTGHPLNQDEPGQQFIN